MKIYDNVIIIPHEENKFGKIGDIYSNCCIGCPIEIGEQVHISFGCHFVGQGKLIIEDNVTISPSVCIYTSSPNFKNMGCGNRYIDGFKVDIADVTIKKGAFIGAGVVIGQGVTIGENAIVGANSFVNKDVPANTIAVGVPARLMNKEVHFKDLRTTSFNGDN